MALDYLRTAAVLIGCSAASCCLATGRAGGMLLSAAITCAALISTDVAERVKGGGAHGDR